MSETAQLKSIRIAGFRSLADVELSDLGRTSVLIGPNGSGKSNFLHFFDMLSWMLKSRRLGEFVERHGGADDQLHGGSRTTQRIEAEIGLDTGQGRNEYRFTLVPAHSDKLIFTEEAFRFSRKDRKSEAPWTHLGGDGHRESLIVDAAQSPSGRKINQKTARTITYLLRNCAGYQFHDTSDNSNFNKRWDVEDNNALRSHGGNLAAILYRLQHEDNRRYEMICRQIARVLPVFDHFQIEESYGKVLLRWKAKCSDKTFGAHLTSDGSLRFFSLVTLLNLPREMLPDVLLLDEPELGLHPAAISLIGEMIKALSHDVQLVVATQSPLLVDVFDLGEIIVLELEEGRTKFRAISADDYRGWLDENFSPGELWQKNLLGGRP